MKEIRDIIQAYTIAKQKQIRTALATVVKVEGSSYRRPGARMLITETGELTGAISGGCLEGDALTKALLAIHQQQNKLVVYDTNDEDDAKLGMQLGCNGIVHILFEPITEKENNPIGLLQKAVAARINAVVGTYFSMNSELHKGTTLLQLANEAIGDADLQNEIFSVITNAESKIIERKESALLMQFITPAIHVIIVGAGNDAQPLMAIADVLGWDITIVDGRRTHATASRFSKATRILIGKPAEVVAHLSTDAQTAVVLMTHNYNYDLALFELLLSKDLPYIGLLGPKKKFERMVGELLDKNITLSEERLKNIYAPVGLDLGAETAEEIALSIVSEIKAILSGASGTYLNAKQNSIHSRS